MTIRLDFKAVKQKSLYLSNYIMGNIDFTETEFQAANYNGDDVINILDILQIINYILSE